MLSVIKIESLKSMSASEEKNRSKEISRFFNPDYELSKKEHEIIENLVIAFPLIVTLLGIIIMLVLYNIYM